jgi:hypothetical protein
MNEDQARVLIEDETNMRQGCIWSVLLDRSIKWPSLNAWDKFGTKIVPMSFISVHFCSVTVRLQPE